MGQNKKIRTWSPRLFMGKPQDTKPDYTLTDFIFPQLDFDPLSRNLAFLKMGFVNFCNNCIGKTNSNCQHN